MCAFPYLAGYPTLLITILLAAFTGIDPPFAAAKRSNSRFIAITESRSLNEVERHLLRRTYEHVLG
jgi:hypothetical protein